MFALKRDSDGKIKRWKARICAQGFSQIEGSDYYATFANTVSFDSIRLALAHIAACEYNLHTVDVRTAYLNATLEDGLDLGPGRHSAPPPLRSGLRTHHVTTCWSRVHTNVTMLVT